MPSRIQPNHLEGMITFLTVARLGRYTAAAHALGVNHSTVSRRIGDLEKALGGKVLVRGAEGWEITDLGTRALPEAERAERALAGLSSLADGTTSPQLRGIVNIAAPDAFTSYIAIPSLAALQCREPRLRLEILTATQQVRQRRAGIDIEVVIGEPVVNRAVTRKLTDYHLRLYATREYLDAAGTPTSVADLAQHRLNYYIETALQVDELDLGIRRIADYRYGISSTSVFAHIAATLAGSGIGLLPDFAVDDPRLVPVLAEEFSHAASYWAVVRDENYRNPAVRACLAALAAAGKPSEPAP
ncbi:LysR family transcriptional regulator [Corynebacterium sp.]|uniref:LysR family transcriptional regulator n=1 Tax=Corynebacterium sp. TaxID=1720 RepID=UPI002647C3F4|nr:LysR family transcriptional regulator [Corynebacterium sp.]MDN6376739.1 LysR family transcriptional regulator [Corynebacterium sp.]MDN6397237.1 LysR family transcriptional regulator [Corynebacterium sp.]